MQQAVPFKLDMPERAYMLQKQTKCVVLARVSSKAQEDEGYSLDAQERLAEEYCTKKAIVVAKIFRIAETASKSKERQVFGEMMKYLVASKINVLVVEKVDRLTRSFRDMVLIDDWLEGDENREAHLIKDSLIMNRRSRSQDKLNWGVKVLFAKNYTDNLREEVYKGRQEKLAQGWLPGKPPIGYKTIGDKGKKIHVPDPANARLINMLFTQYLDPSESLSSVTKYAEKIGIRSSKGRPLSRSALHENIISNPFYIGINRWQRVDYPGKQESIISKDLFESVQVKLHRKKSPKYRRHDPDYRGIIYCSECDGTIAWEYQKGTWYGHCNRYKGCPKKPFARQDNVEEQLFEYFEGLLCPTPEIAEWVVKSLKAKHQEDMHDHTASTDALRAEYDMKKRQLDILYEDRLSERISPERYDEMSMRINDELKEIESNIINMGDRSRKNLLTGIEILEKSQTISKIYANKTAPEKRKLLSEIFISINLNGTDLSATYNPYALAISKRVKMHHETISNFRTKEKTSDSGGSPELVTALRSVWRARPDSNRRSPP